MDDTAINAIQSIASKAKANMLATGLLGKDGLRYCPVCGERIEKVISVCGKTMSVPVACRCRQAELEQEKRQKECQEHSEKVEYLRRRSMLAGAYAEASFKSYEQRDGNLTGLKVASRYCKNFETMYESGQGLIFYGTVGTGKSYTAACVANWLINHEVSVIMTSPMRILRELWDKDSSEEENINRLLRPKLLIIDDLGAERDTEYAWEKISSVIDARVTQKRPMIITTNYTRQELTEDADLRHRRTFDRLLSVCYPVQFTGRSFRMAEAAKRQEEMQKLLEG